MKKFRKAHYEFLARFFNREMAVSTEERKAVVSGIVRLLAGELSMDNPAFDYTRFLDACRVKK